MFYYLKIILQIQKLINYLLMKKTISTLLSNLSSYFSTRKGLLIFIAILCVLINFMLNLFFDTWFTQSNFMLHIGIIIGLLGVLLAWSL